MCCVECGSRSKGSSCTNCGAVRLNPAPDAPERIVFLQTVATRHRVATRFDRTIHVPKAVSRKR